MGEDILITKMWLDLRLSIRIHSFFSFNIYEMTQLRQVNKSHITTFNLEHS